MSESTTTTNQIQTLLHPGPSVKVEYLQQHQQGHHHHDMHEEDHLTATNEVIISTTQTHEEDGSSLMVVTDSSGETILGDQVEVDEGEHDDHLSQITVTTTTAPVPPLVNLKSSLVTVVTSQNQMVVASPTPTPVRHNVVQQQKFQDVRVDNWGNYCLQRLQVMYDRGDFCDLTLQFHTSQLIKVHRVVVNLCTEYFANLERLFGLTDGFLVLPKDVEYQAMVTIIKFFYTGKLEIRGNQFNEVYRTVKTMNITILIKLLEAHAKKPIAQAKKEPTRPIVFKQAVEIGRPLQKGQGHTHQSSGSQVGTTVSIQGSAKTLQVATPGVRLPPGTKTKTVLARVQPQNMRMMSQQSPKSANHKKLPIWKERKYNPASVNDPLMMDKWPIKEETARPTRFEWGDPEDDPSTSTPVVSHALMDKQKGNHSSSSRKVEDIFDAVKNQNLCKRSLMNRQDNSPNKDQPPLKMLKSEPSVNQRQHEEVPLIESQDQPRDTSNDHVNLTEDTVEEEVCTTEAETIPQESHHLSPGLKPALKSQMHPHGIKLTQMVGLNDPNLGDVGKSQEIPSTSSSSKLISLGHKTVRFAPEVEKENNTKNSSEQTSNVITAADDLASSHSKIIAEVLKKYPDLVKDRQNIKLKIVQKGAESTSQTKDKSKISYIVLKSTSSPDSMGTLLKKPVQTAAAAASSPNKAFWDNGETSNKKPSGAENMTGPWLCGPCAGGEHSPLEFDTYYLYRRHLVEVHGERIDARICEYCGQRASKRNLLLYHMYTKHSIPPPKNTHFPACDRCDYVALSESLLNKHKQGHDGAKEFSCLICNASFKSSGALQGHMAANLHRNKDTKVYECPYCRKPFVRNINLKGHIRALHKDIARLEEMDDPRLPLDESLANRSTVSTLQSVKKRQFPSILTGTRNTHVENVEMLTNVGIEGHGQHVSLVTADGHTIEILHGLDPNSMSVPMTLVPSSESEAMTNVASSIAASLGLETQGTTEYMTGVTSDGSPAVYIMDSSQPAVEVDISAMGLTHDGTMIYDAGDDPNAQDQFIVQDIHGNQFRKITGIDENGKPVIFFQLSEDSGQMNMGSNMLEDGIQMTSDSNSVFVSSGGMTMPVSVSSHSGQSTQVLLTTGDHDGTVYEMLPSQDPNQQVVNETHEGDQHHHHHHQFHSEESVDHMGHTVQELHIVLNQNENTQVIEEGVAIQENIIDGEENTEQQLSSGNFVNCGESTEENDLHQSNISPQALDDLNEIQNASNNGSNVIIVEDINQHEQEEEIHHHNEEDTQDEVNENRDENTIQMEIQHNDENVHMIVEDSEQVETQVVIDDEMHLVEEVTGETLQIVEEVSNNESDEMQT